MNGTDHIIGLDLAPEGTGFESVISVLRRTRGDAPTFALIEQRGYAPAALLPVEDNKPGPLIAGVESIAAAVGPCRLVLRTSSETPWPLMLAVRGVRTTTVIVKGGPATYVRRDVVRENYCGPVAHEGQWLVSLRGLLACLKDNLRSGALTGPGTDWLRGNVLKRRRFPDEMYWYNQPGADNEPRLISAALAVWLGCRAEYAAAPEPVEPLAVAKPEYRRLA